MNGLAELIRAALLSDVPPSPSDVTDYLGEDISRSEGEAAFSAVRHVLQLARAGHVQLAAEDAARATGKPVSSFLDALREAGPAYHHPARNPHFSHQQSGA